MEPSKWVRMMIKRFGKYVGFLISSSENLCISFFQKLERSWEEQVDATSTHQVSNSFFLINNVRILLIIKRLPNRVHWGCTMGAQFRKQKNNGQETKKMKNKKNEKKPHSIQRVCKKKDLISSKELSQPSKLRAFLSRQMHQIKQ